MLCYFINAYAEINTIMAVEPIYIGLDLLMWIKVCLMIIILVSLWINSLISKKLLNWSIPIALSISLVIFTILQAMGLLTLMLLFSSLVVRLLNFKVKI